MPSFSDIQRFIEIAKYYEEDSLGVCCPNPHDPWFSLYFDGTGNNRFIDEKYKRQSNVAKLYAAHKEQPEQGIERQYFIGVGTRSDDKCPYTWARDSMIFGGGFGLGGKARIAQAQKSLVDFFETHSKAPRKNIALFGFSRGAALARYMAHLLVKDGIKIKGRKEPLRAGKDFNIRFLGIFDTVSSFYFPGTDFSLDYEFDVPPEVEKVAHFVAAHERRAKFDLQSIRTASNASPRAGWVERIYPGMHADIGGGYAPDEQGRTQDLSKIVLNDMYDEAVKAGVPLMPHEQLQGIADYQSLYEPAPEARAALAEYQALVPETTDLGEGLRNHERLFYRWLGHCIDRGGWSAATQAFFLAEESALSNKLQPLRARVTALHQENWKILREENRKAPHPLSGSQVQMAARERTMASTEYKKLKDMEEALKVLEENHQKLDHAFLDLKKEYDSIVWKARYEKKLPVSWPPPYLVRQGSPHKEQIRILPLKAQERLCYQWMNEAPLTASLIDLFDRWIHDSVAHTPDPLGDSYFAARDVYYQHDGKWKDSDHKALA